MVFIESWVYQVDCFQGQTGGDFVVGTEDITVYNPLTRQLPSFGLQKVSLASLQTYGLIIIKPQAQEAFTLN